jgi:septal ring factor EnvC (AmiA/AmiB activator)
MAEDDEGLRQRLTRQGEEAVGKLAQDLLENPLFANTLAAAFEAREKAMQAQTAAMSAMNLPSAADIERLTRRLRSVSQRLEGIEDAIDRLEERLRTLDERLADHPADESLERRLDEIARDIASLRDAVAPPGQPVPRAQERLTVSE